MDKKQKINTIIDSPEFLMALKGLNEEQRELIENSARELLGDLFDSFNSVEKRFNERKLDDNRPVNVVKEKE